MTLRIKLAVAATAFLSLMLLGACGSSEDVSGDIGTDVAAPNETATPDVDIDLASVNLKEAVSVQIEAATAAGTYDCCLAMPCSMCLVMMGACPCEDEAEAGGEVCRECKGGWDAGGGHIDGMTTDDINVMPPMGGM